MEILRVLGITLTAGAALLMLRAQGRGDIAFLVSAAFAGLMLFWVVAQLAPAIQSLTAMLREANLQEETIALLLKVAGVALVSEFAAQICRDAGEASLASKAELAGKASVLLMALTPLLALCRLALSLIP
ncbi:MAG: stage III sporulation protein AD [Christensenellaceae bacterium]|jgi:stage III sporulation protein AD|nr:stage III sporulation protein AD [Christensenellaceae bacterium]